jgi:hypothetical protein
VIVAASTRLQVITTHLARRLIGTAPVLQHQRCPRWVRTDQAAAYVEYITRTRLSAYKQTPGNLGARM